MKSRTAVSSSIVAALVKAEKILGSDRVWTGVNSDQNDFLKIFESSRREVPAMPEIESLASWKAEDINEFLKSRGFDIQLDPFGSDIFGIAAVLKMLMMWKYPGIKTEIRCADAKTYPAAALEDGLGYFQSQLVPNPVVAIATESGDVVYLTRLDEGQTGPLGLLHQAQEIVQSLRPKYDWGNLIFPMVDLNVQEDVTWLLNMETKMDSGRKAWLSQALQQNKLKMNHIGALAESAFAGAVTTEMFIMPKPSLMIDGPFLVIVTRPGFSWPLFTAHVTYPDFKDPGDFIQ